MEPSVWETIAASLDVAQSYGTATEMASFGTHAALGFRTSGSEAEFKTGDYLYEKMRAIGLDASKDEITVDSWIFTKARLTVECGEKKTTMQLSAYQTQFVTDGEETFTLINAGRGTAAEFDKIDAKGKLCLVFINQRDEWWINYPAYQAHIRGAKAIIAVQNSGFGTVNDGALNAQDICGPASAPAFSLSREDAKTLIKAGLAFGESTPVKFEAESRVETNEKTYNITGIIPGKTDAMILVSAHYDAYFGGFQDDNTGVAMLLTMADAIKKSGYKPEKTLAFCAFAAEEWGTVDSRYDWSAGAYAQLKTAHPEWAQKTVLNVNLELPAFSHGARHYVRCVYEYKSFIKAFVAKLPESVKRLYPKGVGVLCPVQTWSDDFALSLAGVPSLVNEFRISPFMETHYHSQYDCAESYDEKIYKFHHFMYTHLLLSADAAALPPLNFGTRFKAMGEALTDQNLSVQTEGDFRKAAEDAKKAGKKLYETIVHFNAEAKTEDADFKKTAALRRKLLKLFLRCQDEFVALDWYETAVFPFENAQKNVRLLKAAAVCLTYGDKKGALKNLCEIDDNGYAAFFDREVTDYFYLRATTDGEEKLKWGFGRLRDSGRLDLSGVITQIAHTKKSDDFSSVIIRLMAYRQDEHERLERLLEKVTKSLSAVTAGLKSVTKKLNKRTENE